MIRQAMTGSMLRAKEAHYAALGSLNTAEQAPSTMPGIDPDTLWAIWVTLGCRAAHVAGAGRVRLLGAGEAEARPAAALRLAVRLAIHAHGVAAVWHAAHAPLHLLPHISMGVAALLVRMISRQVVLANLCFRWTYSVTSWQPCSSSSTCDPQQGRPGRSHMPAAEHARAHPRQASGCAPGAPARHGVVFHVGLQQAALILRQQPGLPGQQPPHLPRKWYLRLGF